jgi:hypothetical protein
MRHLHPMILIALLSVVWLAPRASAHYRPHSRHDHLNRRAAIPTSAARLRRPLDLTEVFPDSSVTMGLSGAVLVDPGLDGVERRLDQGMGMDLNVGVRLGQPLSVHLACLSTVHPSQDPTSERTPGVLTELSFDIRAFLNPNARFIEPFLQLGTGIVEISRSGSAPDPEIGATLHAGFGIHVPVHRNLALTATALYRPSLIARTDSNAETAMPHLITGSVGLTFRL